MSAFAASFSRRFHWSFGFSFILALMATPAAFAGFSTATGTSRGLPAPGASVRMVFGDFNNDGRVDVLYQTGGNGTAWGYAQGNFGGTFTVTTTPGLPGTPFAGVTQFDFTGTGATLTAADFNGDGRTDIWFAVNGSSGTILWNGPSGFTSAAASTYNFPAPAAISRSVTGDFNGDGFADILYQTGANGTPWGYAAGSGSGNMTITTAAGLPGTPFAGIAQFDFTGTGSILRAGDFNGDARTDVWWHINGDDGKILWNGPGGFTLADGATYNFPAVGATTRLVTGDFDSDGIDDLFYQTGANGTAWGFAKGSNSGTFTITTAAGLPGTPFAGVTQFDFTGTGSLLTRGDVSGDFDDDFWYVLNGSAGTLFNQDGSPPLLVSSTPADNATAVPLTTNISLTFDQTVAPGVAGNITLKKTSDNSTVVAIPVTGPNVTGSGATWTATTGVTLLNATGYYVLIDAGAFINSNGQYYTGIVSPTALNFTTIAATSVVTNVSATTADGSYGPGATIAITVSFNQPVVVTGTPLLQLNSGGSVFASYASGSGGTTLTFNYTVAAGENSPDLDYVSTGALTLNGGTINGPDSVPAVLTLPAPGAAGSLGANKDIVIDSIAPVITSAASASGTYGSPFAAYTITASGGATSFGALGLPSGLTVLGGVISGTPTQSGVFNVTLTATDAAGNTGTAPLTITIAQAVLTVAADPKSRAYGAADPAFTATFSGFVLGDTLGTAVTGAPSFNVNAVATSPAGGTYIITPSLGTLAAANYTFTFLTAPFTITPAVLAVTANAASRLYGAADPVFTATFSGFVNGETLATSGVTGAPSFTTNAVATSAVGGAYLVTPALGTLSAVNYVFNFVSAPLTITPAPLTVTADPKSRAYGAADPVFTATFSGFANGETLATSGVTGAPSFTTDAIATSPAGGIYTITPALGTLAANNYSFGPFVGAALTVTKAPLTVAANPASRAYGAADPVFSATFSGFANGETLATSGVTGAPSFTTDAIATSPVGGIYTITPALGTLAANNYSFGPFAGAALTVTKAPLLVTADDASRAYGAANPAFTATITGFVNGETLATSGVTGAAALSTPATPASAVGTYPIVAAAGTLAANNYSFSFVDGTLTIGQATLTYTAQNQTRTYGAANPALTVAITGFVNGETLATSGVTGAPALATTAVATSPVGAYPITVTVGTLAAANYSFTFVSGTLTVNKAALTVAANNASKVYGAANPAFTATLSGFVNGETLATSGVAGTASFSTTATAASGVGTYPITPAVGTLTSANYAFTSFVNGTLTITPAALAVTANNASRIFGVANPTFTATISGFVNGDTVATATTGAASLTTPATIASPVGTYPITPTLGTLAAANYVFTPFVPGTLTITPAVTPATVVLSDLVQAYDGTPKNATATTTPLGLAVSLTYDGNPTAPTLPGSYAVVATITDPGYTGSATGTLVITVSVLVRHGPTLNGDIDGSLQVLLPESFTLNGGSMVSNDILVPGTPNVQLNGNPVIAGVQNGAGSPTPTNYTITLNGNTLVRYVVRRTDPIAMPVVTPPQAPLGTRNVTLNNASDSPGDFTTLRNLTLNGNAGSRAIPAGAYGNFTANGNGGFILGVVGATTPSVYHLQQLTLNGNATLQIVGPVILKLAQSVTFNATVGSAANPGWLTVEISGGGATLNGNATLHGEIVAPNGTVTVNSGTVRGRVTADRLTINGNGLIDANGP